MKKSYYVIIVLLIPIFFINSSKLSFDKIYPNLEIKTTKGIIIDNTVYSFSSNYVIHAVANGYEKKSFEFNHYDNIRLIKLNEIPSQITFSSNIKNFLLYEDGKEVKNKTLKLYKGEYSYILESDGYFDIEYNLKVDKYNSNLLIPVTFKPINKVVSINTTPSNADIYINKNLVGVSPMSLRVDKKITPIRIVKNGHQSKDFVIYAKDNLDELLTLNLDKNENTTSIESYPDEALIFINNEYKGITPKGVTISKGDTLALKKEGYIDNLEVVENINNKISVKLKPDYANVSINSSPSSEVYIFNSSIGTTPITTKLIKSDTVISFKKDGYITKILNLKITNDMDLNENLKTIKQDAIDKSSINKINSINMNLVLFNPGRIVTGSDKRESRRQINEVRRNIVLSKHFYVSDSLVTKAQFGLYAKQTNNSLEPIGDISWINAIRFCNWLSKKESLEPAYTINDNEVIFNNNSIGYRLLSEAEWEYIAKSNLPNGQLYSWGFEKTISGKPGNLADESAKSKFSQYIQNYDDGYIEVSPIKSFKPNQNGIYDITGNLSEWVYDYYSTEITDISKEYIDYFGPSYGVSRVIKGSNYKSTTASQLGLSYRGYSSSKNDVIGFRIARWIY